MRKNRFGYLYILPIFVLFLFYIVYPLFFIIQTSFFKWNGMSANKEYVGLNNYISVLQDSVILIIIRNFVVFGVLTIFTQMIFGLIFALIIKNKVPFSGVFKTIMFLPVVITTTVIAKVASKLFEYNFGFINTVLRSLNLDFLALQWLSDEAIVVLVLAILNIWQYTGFSMVMYIAGLSTISDDILEAAKIDGSGKLRTLIYIIWPSLRNTHFTLTILGAIGVLKNFDIVWILTEGGPNNASEFFPTYIFKKSFQLYDAGAASVISVLLFLAALIITVLQLKLYNRRDGEV